MVKDKLSLFMDMLDEKNKKIFWYFRCHGYGRLAKLTEFIGASTDMEVLQRIKDVINPTAVRIFGSPLLEFCESKIDRATGKKVFFNWWLLGFTENDQPQMGEGGKSLVDLFDENDQILIVCEISPSITVSGKAKVEQRHGILYIRLDKLPVKKG